MQYALYDKVLKSYVLIHIKNSRAGFYYFLEIYLRGVTGIKNILLRARANIILVLPPGKCLHAAYTQSVWEHNVIFCVFATAQWSLVDRMSDLFMYFIRYCPVSLAPAWEGDRPLCRCYTRIVSTIWAKRCPVLLEMKVVSPVSKVTCI